MILTLLPQRNAHISVQKRFNEKLKADLNTSTRVKTGHPGEQLSRTIAHGTPSTSCLHRRMDDALGGRGDLVYLPACVSTLSSAAGADT